MGRALPKRFRVDTLSGAGSMITFDPEGNRLEGKVIPHQDPLT
jgi:hypothetical protein